MPFVIVHLDFPVRYRNFKIIWDELLSPPESRVMRRGWSPASFCTAQDVGVVGGAATTAAPLGGGWG